MNLNNLKNVQVSSIHGRDLFLPRKFDIDNGIYIESVDGFVTALFDYLRRGGNIKDLDLKKVYEKSCGMCLFDQIIECKNFTERRILK